MVLSQGDVVLIPFPFTDQSGTKNRPALVVSGAKLNSTDDIVLVQITRVSRMDYFSVALSKPEDLTVPLRYVSEIRCQKILVAHQGLILQKISQVKPHIIREVLLKIEKVFES
jgi:mRNA interferase MazF